MPTFRKKPVEIQAIQFTDAASIGQLFDFFGAAAWEADDKGVHIPTLEGVMTASLGDWIIRGVKGEFYPCKPDIFAATYDSVDVEHHPV